MGKLNSDSGINHAYINHQRDERERATAFGRAGVVAEATGADNTFTSRILGCNAVDSVGRACEPASTEVGGLA